MGTWVQPVVQPAVKCLRTLKCARRYALFSDCLKSLNITAHDF